MTDRRWRLEVPGMTCGHCESAVRDELGHLSGITGVEVDLETKIVLVTGGGLSAEMLTDAIDEAGFEVAAITSVGDEV